MDWLYALIGGVLVIASALLAIWWRQRTPRWLVLVAICLTVAPILSYWSGLAFRVADYRAGCDGLCPGYGGAPVHFITGEADGNRFRPAYFVINSLVYLTISLAWAAVVRTVLMGLQTDSLRRPSFSLLVGLGLLIAPILLSPLFLPPPEAMVRGDSLRIAINARREVYMYDQLSSWPILRVALEDVRPRPDDEPGMRVCYRTFTLFYLPAGHMYMDMTLEGVHSNHGGVRPLSASCWER